MGDFVSSDWPQSSNGRWWPVPAALVIIIALTTCGLYWLAGLDRPWPQQDIGAWSAQSFADAAAAAFTGSTTITIPSSPAAAPGEWAAGLSTAPLAGPNWATPAKPVLLVLPDGLGAAQRISGGSVVYPDTRTSFDFPAENNNAAGVT